MSESIQDKLHKIRLGLGDLKTLHTNLAEAINKRVERIKVNGKLEGSGKDEIRLLARIDQLKCALRDRCNEIANHPDLQEKGRKSLRDVSETMGRLKDIDLTFPTLDKGTEGE